jgi:hypothetical protein
MTHSDWKASFFCFGSQKWRGGNMEFIYSDNEYALMVLIGVGGLGLFFIVLLLVSWFASRLSSSFYDGSSYKRGSMRDEGENQSVSPPQRSPVNQDMITGEALNQRYLTIHLIGASGLPLSLPVSMATARALNQGGIAAIMPLLVRRIGATERNRSAVRLVGPRGIISYSSEQWRDELAGAVLARTALPAQPPSIASNIKPDWSVVGLPAVDKPPALPPASSLPPLCVDDGLDDEPTVPFTCLNKIFTPSRMPAAPSLSSEDAELTFQRVEQLLHRYLEVSNGVDHRSILLRDGIPLGYPSGDYGSIEIDALSEDELAELLESLDDDERKGVVLDTLPADPDIERMTVTISRIVPVV